MRSKPNILCKQIVARSRLFRIESVDLRFANGTEATHERLASSVSGAVLVVPMPDPQTILLVREYAVGTERYELGFPKGRLEPDEDPGEAANRELMEEMGYGSRRITFLQTLTVAPSYWGLTTQVFLAEELYARRLPGDEPENLEVIPWPLAALDELLRRDDFWEARSVAAALLVHRRLHRRDTAS